MDRLLFHPATRQTLENTLQHLPQSLLLSGQSGVGLFTAAKWLAGKNLAAELHPQDKKGSRDDETGTISVEAVRSLYEQTRAKYTRHQLIIVDNAERMSRGAQNAFLKLLEEPNEHVHFILTSHAPQQLLPTVRSRMQHVVIQPVSAESSAEFIASLGDFDTTKKAQLQFTAPGLPAELTRLAADEALFNARAEIIGDARDFLQGTVYKKLLVAHKHKASRAAALQLCDSALYILRRSISAKPQPALISQLERLLEARESIAANGNIALQLARFVL